MRKEYATDTLVNVTLPQRRLFDLRSYRPLVGLSSSDYVLANANFVLSNYSDPGHFSVVFMAVNKNRATIFFNIVTAFH